MLYPLLGSGQVLHGVKDAGEGSHAMFYKARKVLKGKELCRFL